jgi:hypothetical protein
MGELSVCVFTVLAEFNSKPISSPAVTVFKSSFRNRGSTTILLHMFFG